MLIGRKIGMTQLFTDEGRCVPVTQISLEDTQIIREKTTDSDGYRAMVVGYGSKKDKNIRKAQKGEFGEGSFEGVAEFRAEGEDEALELADLDSYEEGTRVTVSGTSKSKGFQGVVKRWNFAGGPKSHGQKHTLRTPGSIGATGPQRVFKGLKMAGRTGGKKTTVKNLTLAKVDSENKVIYIEGAVPGRRDTLITITKTPLPKKKKGLA